MGNILQCREGIVMLKMICQHCRVPVANSDVTTRELNVFEPCCDDAKREISHLKAHFTKQAHQHGKWKVDTIDIIGNIIDTNDQEFVEPSFYEDEMHR